MEKLYSLHQNHFRNGWWESAYPSSYPLAISHRNHQKSLAYFSHLAPLALFFFTKRRSQKGGGEHGTMAPLNSLLSLRLGL